jgi:hypothetical protein
MTIEKQTAPELELESGEETEQNLPLFPNLPADEAQDSFDIDWEKFDWLNDPSVILRDQAGVMAYLNRYGELVIRQRDTLGEPAVLYIAPENVKAFLKGLAARARDGADE